jgi:soluble lytic murein transglycosylase-like protein
LDPLKGLILAIPVVALGLGGTAARAEPGVQFDKQTTDRLQILHPFIADASDRFEIPEAWIRAVIAAESSARTTVNGAPITSRAGAIGPMQVMPRTYDELRRRYQLGPDPADPEQNILGGTAYLKELYERFGRDGMFAAYNAGPERYQAYLDGQLPLPEETRAYLATLGNVVSGIAQEPIFSSGKSLFFAITDQTPGSTEGQSAPSTGALFIPLSPSQLPAPLAKK